MLHYLVRLVKSNDAELCDFGKDLVHVPEAQGIILDSLISEFKALQEELVGVHETAKQQADRLAQAGEVQQVSLQELKEQRTSIRSIERVPQYNQMDHLTGRTSMERFTIGAKKALESAAEFADQVEMNYSKLLEFLCEDEGTSSNEFFGLMWKFVTEFNNAVEQVNKEEKAKVSASTDKFGVVYRSCSMSQLNRGERRNGAQQSHLHLPNPSISDRIERQWPISHS